jgi:hypothetical protein
MKTITVTIAPDGKVTVHVQGVPGKTCTDITKAMETALGTVESIVLTSEYAQDGDDQTGTVLA